MKTTIYHFYGTGITYQGAKKEAFTQQLIELRNAGINAKKQTLISENTNAFYTGKEFYYMIQDVFEELTWWEKNFDRNVTVIGIVIAVLQVVISLW